MENKYFFRVCRCVLAPGENIFKTRRIPFSREKQPASPWFRTAVLGQEIPKIIYNNAARFDSPALRNARRLVTDSLHENSDSIRTLSYNVCLTAVSFRHAYPAGR